MEENSRAKVEKVAPYATLLSGLYIIYLVVKEIIKMNTDFKWFQTWIPNIVIIMIFIVSICIAINEKYKKSKKQNNEYRKIFQDLQKEPANRVAAINQLSERINRLEQDVYRVIRKKEEPK